VRENTKRENGLVAELSLVLILYSNQTLDE